MELVIVPVFLVFAVGVYLLARIGAAADPTPPKEQLAQLRAYHTRLQSDLQRAQTQGWDHVLVAQLTDKIRETELEIARRPEIS